MPQHTILEAGNCEAPMGQQRGGYVEIDRWQRRFGSRRLVRPKSNSVKAPASVKSSQ
jgi:hypothetical protein